MAHTPKKRASAHGKLKKKTSSKAAKALSRNAGKGRKPGSKNKK